MELQSLKLFVTDDDVTKMVEPLLGEQDAIEELKVRLTPEGVTVQGQYPTGFGFKLPFETLWQVIGDGPALVVRLASVQVAGLPGGMLRGVLMRMARDQLAGQPGASVDEEAVRLDVPEAARAQGIDLRVNFTTVTMSIGAAVIEAG